MTDTDQTAEDPDDLDGDEAAELEYDSVHAFVENWFTQTISRPLGGTHRWCPTWFEHPEAVLRLDALWRAYEHLQGDPSLGPITFLTHHLDPTLTVLLAPTGPFARCTPDRHEPHQQLPVELQPGRAPRNEISAGNGQGLSPSISHASAGSIAEHRGSRGVSISGTPQRPRAAEAVRPQ